MEWTCVNLVEHFYKFIQSELDSWCNLRDVNGDRIFSRAAEMYQ